MLNNSCQLSLDIEYCLPVELETLHGEDERVEEQPGDADDDLPVPPGLWSYHSVQELNGY